ncbi:MAG: cyclic nucleotide-binding domain-containing protein [Bacteriovorax sp.]|nr:cyclic nucleotide-binding domain-containing protein [Bacteriovorax sp.]
MVNLPLGKPIEAPIMFKAGTVIFALGEPAKYLYLLKKGEIRLLKVTGQKLSVIKLCKEKEILNEVSVLTNKPSEFAAIAKTDVELVLIDQKDILTVVKDGPSWIPEIFETLCERLKSTQDIIEEHNLSAGEKNSDMVLTKDEEKGYLNALAEYKIP